MIKITETVSTTKKSRKPKAKRTPKISAKVLRKLEEERRLPSVIEEIDVTEDEDLTSTEAQAGSIHDILNRIDPEIKKFIKGDNILGYRICDDTITVETTNITVIVEYGYYKHKYTLLWDNRKAELERIYTPSPKKSKTDRSGNIKKQSKKQ